MENPNTPDDIRCLISFYAQRDDWWVVVDPPDAFFQDLGWMPDILKKHLVHGDIGVFISPTKMQIFLIPKKVLSPAVVFLTFPDMKPASDAPTTRNVIFFNTETLVSFNAWLTQKPGETIQ